MKPFMMDNAAHLFTINAPLVSGIRRVSYNTARPLFKPLFDRMVLKGIPHSVDDYAESTDEVIRQFLSTEYVFDSPVEKMPPAKSVKRPRSRAVVAFSSGKDSLLSLALARELGLDPVAVYVNDTVSPSENSFKLARIRSLGRETDVPFVVVRNELERLNDFETWSMPETCVGYTHMMTGFCFVSLPVAHARGAGFIVLGNQRNMEFGYVNKDGYATYPSYDQTQAWMRTQREMVELMSAGSASVTSLIAPLTNIAIMRILHNRYPEFAKHQVSCDSLNASDEPRWCHECSKCARLSIMMLSTGASPKSVGMRKSMLGKGSERFYAVFGGSGVDCYEQSRQSVDEQKFAFYLAYRNGARGYLIDRFRRRFLDEVRSREDELHRMFFSFNDMSIVPSFLRRGLASVCGEELSGL